jgi:hypothetical protein
MITPDRRQLFRMAAAALLLPAAAGQTARAAARGAVFKPPMSPMLYVRRLRRELADGASLAVSRSFAVQFKQDGSGFRIEGDQVDVTVDAPAALARFAALERERKEQELFPLMLDLRGQIVGVKPVNLSAQIKTAVDEVAARIDRAKLDSDTRIELNRLLNAIHQGASQVVTELPKDLFAPVQTEEVMTREVALLNGASGAVTVHFSAVTDSGTGLMKQALREVVTDLAGDRRRTVESWQLTRI